MSRLASSVILARSSIVLPTLHQSLSTGQIIRQKGFDVNKYNEQNQNDYSVVYTTKVVMYITIRKCLFLLESQQSKYHFIVMCIMQKSILL
jgi:hypothetical protein